jgi:anaerobic magnesium-protoporphyrin IX monomethyl ester cyclase
VIHKPVDLKKSPAIVRKAKELGLTVAANYVIGFPQETRQELMRTFTYAEDLIADQSIFGIATPYNHTRLTDDAKELGLLPDDFIFDSLMPGTTYWDGPDWTREELEQWRYENWRKCNFGTPERKARYELWTMDNPAYQPAEKPIHYENKIA